jgi:cytochrome P450
VRLVLSDRDLWQRLRADPATADAIVEESIRLEPSVTAWRRRTKVDVELDGIAVPADSVLLLMLAAANRDPARFPEPDVLDPERANSRDHLSFGFGIHYCLGAQLARMQISELLAQLATLFPTLELVADQQLTYIPNTSFRGPERLLVTQNPDAGEVSSEKDGRRGASAGQHPTPI